MPGADVTDYFSFFTLRTCYLLLVGKYGFTDYFVSTNALDPD